MYGTQVLRDYLLLDQHSDVVILFWAQCVLPVGGKSARIWRCEHFRKSPSRWGEDVYLVHKTPALFSRKREQAIFADSQYLSLHVLYIMLGGQCLVHILFGVPNWTLLYKPFLYWTNTY